MQKQIMIKITILNPVFCTFMHGIGFVRIEDEVALVTFIAEGVRKVL